MFSPIANPLWRKAARGKSPQRSQVRACAPTNGLDSTGQDSEFRRIANRAVPTHPSRRTDPNPFRFGTQTVSFLRVPGRASDLERRPCKPIRAKSPFWDFRAPPSRGCGPAVRWDEPSHGRAPHVPLIWFRHGHAKPKVSRSEICDLFIRHLPTETVDCWPIRVRIRSAIWSFVRSDVNPDSPSEIPAAYSFEMLLPLLWY